MNVGGDLSLVWMKESGLLGLDKIVMKNITIDQFGASPTTAYNKDTLQLKQLADYSKTEIEAISGITMFDLTIDAEVISGDLIVEDFTVKSLTTKSTVKDGFLHNIMGD